MTMLIFCAMLAATVGGAIVVLTIAVLATTRSRPRRPDPAADHRGDHRTIT
jgi:hypothetical protein